MTKHEDILTWPGENKVRTLRCFTAFPEVDGDLLSASSFNDDVAATLDDCVSESQETVFPGTSTNHQNIRVRCHFLIKTEDKHV